ncbi:MAG: hypothetical protein IPK12_14170 [Gemmatimonadetes bacterium]|nr:hypothetical protein [Gemmatimonadota bacterium]
MSVARRIVAGRARTLVMGAVASATLLSACAKKDEAPPAPAGPPLVAMVRAADWMGSEWSEDAIKFGLSEMGPRGGKDYRPQDHQRPGDIATLPRPARRRARREGGRDRGAAGLTCRWRSSG